MQRHVALDLAMQRLSGTSGDPGWSPDPAGEPSSRPSKLELRARVRVAVLALRGDLDAIRSLTTQPPSSRIGS